MNFSYNDSDISGINESSLKVWKYNGSWIESGWNGARVLDTTANIVGVNITSFSVFAPLGQPPAPPPSAPTGGGAALPYLEPKINEYPEPADYEATMENIPRGMTITLTPEQSGMTITGIVFTAMDNMKNASLNITRPPGINYTLGAAEIVYDAFDVSQSGLKYNNATLEFRIEKGWADANEIDADQTVIQQRKDGVWQPLPTQRAGEDDEYQYYTATVVELSAFSVVATSPPLLCGICKAGDWSACVDGEQTRLNEDCGSHTGYACRPIVEARPCEAPLPTRPPLPLDIIIIPIIGFAVVSYVVFSKRTW